MKKKILSLFVTFTMLCGFISIFTVTSANASGYNDFYQIYLADYLSENTVAAS